MDVASFKNIGIVLQYGFDYYKNNTYYCDDTNNVIVINIQKSQWSEDQFYINFGILVKCLHTNCNIPRIEDCDISARFNCIMSSEIKYMYDLGKLNKEILEKNITNNMIEIIEPIKKEGISRYFEIYPQAVNSAKLILKNYLDI